MVTSSLNICGIKLHSYNLVAENRDKYGNKDALIMLTEEGIDQLMSAVEHLDMLADGRTFEDDEEMLHEVAKALPPVFTKGTRFERKDS